MEIGEVKMKDKCINCKCETLYDKETHIDFRLGYVEGAGQLCLDCWDTIYGVDKYSYSCYPQWERQLKEMKKKEVKNENE
jgi:hypothetical protein